MLMKAAGLIAFAALTLANAGCTADEAEAKAPTTPITAAQCLPAPDAVEMDMNGEYTCEIGATKLITGGTVPCFVIAVSSCVATNAATVFPPELKEIMFTASNGDGEMAVPMIQAQVATQLIIDGSINLTLVGTGKLGSAGLMQFDAGQSGATFGFQ